MAVSEKFGNNSFKTYGLCPSHYLSAISSSWDVTLNTTKAELELIPDSDMLFEKGIRGGVSYITKRYSKANNTYLKSYDPKQESKHIYLDLSNDLSNVMQCLSSFQQVDSNGKILKILT